VTSRYVPWLGHFFVSGWLIAKWIVVRRRNQGQSKRWIAQTLLSLNGASPYFCSSFPLDQRFPSAL
jgi:hypothetical protein